MKKLKIPFSHNKEFAKPGYYSVELSNQVKCAFTATKRTGLHEYQFPTKEGWLMLAEVFYPEYKSKECCNRWMTTPLLDIGSAQDGRRGKKSILLLGLITQ